MLPQLSGLPGKWQFSAFNDLTANIILFQFASSHVFYKAAMRTLQDKCVCLESSSWLHIPGFTAWHPALCSSVCSCSLWAFVGCCLASPCPAVYFLKRKNVGPAVKRCGFTKRTLIRRLMRDGEGRSQEVFTVWVCGLCICANQLVKTSSMHTCTQIHTWSKSHHLFLNALKTSRVYIYIPIYLTLK